MRPAEGWTKDRVIQTDEKINTQTGQNKQINKKLNQTDRQTESD